jgi:FAD/FMN-containing dehydrogenase
MKDKNILQNCLPGVTVHHYNNEQYQGYQSLQVECPPGVNVEPSVQDEWLEERRRQQQKSSRTYNLCVLLVFFLVLAKWHTTSTTSTTTSSTTIIPNRQSTSTTSFGSTSLGMIFHEDNEDERHEAILHALTKLDEELKGDIVSKSTKPKFVEAARVWRTNNDNNNNNGLPLAVIEAHSQQDVETAVPILAGLAKDFGLKFRVRSGGHSHGVGYSSVAGGVVLSLSKLTSIQLVHHPANNNTTVNNNTTNNNNNNNNNETTTTVVMEPGVRVEEFLRQVLDQHGYAGVVADGARVGMGGFVLGGGYGDLSRKYGLGSDTVVRLKVVLTNGVVTNVEPGDDLFWALRGAGGANLGVVTELEVRVYPCEDMKLKATVHLPWTQAPGFLQKLGDKEPELAGAFIAKIHGYQRQPQPSKNNSTSNATTMLHRHDAEESLIRHVDEASSTTTMEEDGTTIVSLYWMGDDDDDDDDNDNSDHKDSDRASIGMDYLKEHVVPLLPNQSRLDVSYYYFSWYGMSRQKEQPETWTTVFAAQSWNGFLFAENNTLDVWQDIRDDLSVLFRYCTPYLSPKINLWGGAIATNRSSQDDTAFPYRQALYHVGVELLIPNTTENAQQVFQQQSALVGAVWPSIAQYLTGVYINYPMPSLSQRDYPRAYWGENLERLMQLKQQYDPFHLLHFEQSIPTTTPTKKKNGTHFY